MALKGRKNGCRHGSCLESLRLRMPDPANPVLLYDGVCGLCNRLVRFVLKRDRHAHFCFASLQSHHAARILEPHGLHPHDLNTLYVLADERLSTRADAVIFILRELGGLWRVAAAAFSIFPKPIRDWGYNVAARHRYRVFGKYESCPLPERKYQDRFLDA
jgi:predicted DCC family thiol-disulfide oxidoreductase YuxK